VTKRAFRETIEHYGTYLFLLMHRQPIQFKAKVAVGFDAHAAGVMKIFFWRTQRLASQSDDVKWKGEDILSFSA
jgi:hypothetical protein